MDMCGHPHEMDIWMLNFTIGRPFGHPSLIVHEVLIGNGIVA